MHNDKTLIHLLVDNAYIEQLMQELPRDKVVVVEKNFRQNQKLYKDVLKKYQNDKSDNFIPYYESMKGLNDEYFSI